MNSNFLNSETITPINHKYFNKFNLNNLNLSLTNSIENSSFIILKDGTIKPKRHKNSYFEGYLDNKRLSMAMKGEEQKIRRVKSLSVNDTKKKNKFYKTNFWNFQNFDYNENNPVKKVQKINMYENVFIDENSKNDFIPMNIDKKIRFSHNNYYNNLNLNYSYNDIIRPSIRNNNICCNCNKYDPKSNCKYDILNNKSNKSVNILEKKDRYKNLGKYLNKNNINLNNIRNNLNSYNSYSNMLNKNEKEENNKTNSIYNFNKFNLTFKSTPQENEKVNEINKIKYSPQFLKIINNEKIEYDSKSANSSKSINFNKNMNSIEQCRINTKNTNFVSKILSEEISPIKPNLNYKYNITANNDTRKNSVESIFNLSIMNKNLNDIEKNQKDDKRKNYIIFKNDNIGKFNYNNQNRKIPNYLHFDQLKNNYNYYERVHKNGKMDNIESIYNKTKYHFKKDFNNVLNSNLGKNQDSSFNPKTTNNIDNYHKINFDENYDKHNICITTDIKNEKNEENTKKTLIYNNDIKNKKNEENTKKDLIYNNSTKSINRSFNLHNKDKTNNIFNDIINSNKEKIINKNDSINNNFIQNNNGFNFNARQNLNINNINNNKDKTYINNKNNSAINKNNNYQFNNDNIMNTINLIKTINNKDNINNNNNIQSNPKNDIIKQIRRNKSFSNKSFNPVQNKSINPVQNKLINPVQNKSFIPAQNKLINPVQNKLINPVQNKLINPVQNKLINPVQNKLKPNQINKSKNPGKIFYNYNGFNLSKASLTIKGDIANNGKKNKNKQIQKRDKSKKTFKNNKNKAEISKVRKDYNKIYFDKNKDKEINSKDIKNPNKNNNIKNIKNMTEKISKKAISNYNNIYTNSNQKNNYNLKKDLSSNDLKNKSISQNSRTYFYTFNKNKEYEKRKINKNNILNELNNNSNIINKRNKTYYYSSDLQNKNSNNIKNKSEPKNNNQKLVENNNKKEKSNNKKKIEDNKLLFNYHSNFNNHKYFESKNLNKSTNSKTNTNYKYLKDKNELNAISSLKMNINECKYKSIKIDKPKNNNNQGYQIYNTNKLKIKEIKNLSLKNDSYKTKVNSPSFNNNNKIKKVLIKNQNERYKNLNKIRSLKNLLNSSTPTPIVLYSNKINNQNQRKINYKNEILDSTQNERQMKFYDYTFSQKSDNTNNNYYSNSISNFSLNVRSSNLRDLIEENKKRTDKILKKGKIHSYSPKIKNNFSFIKNFKNGSHYSIYDNKKTNAIRNIIPQLNLIYKEEPINYYYNSHSAKIFDKKKYQKMNPKKGKSKKRNLIKEIKYKNKKYNLDTDYNYNDKISSNKIYKKFFNNIFIDKVRINALSENKNMKFKYNFEGYNKTLLNNNKSFDCIMPPNDLSDIYKKNLIFSQMFNKE